MAYDPAYQLSAEQLKSLIEDSPFFSRFNYDLSLSNDAGLVTRLPFSDHLIGNAIIKAIHGGVVASFLENTAWLEVSARLGEEVSLRPFTTTNDYLRPTEDHDLFARAQVVKWGKRSVSVVATAWQKNSDKPVSQASCHFLISAKS